MPSEALQKRSAHAAALCVSSPLLFFERAIVAMTVAVSVAEAGMGMEAVAVAIAIVIAGVGVGAGRGWW